MKRHFVPLAAAAMALGTTASADPFIDAVVKNFQNLGYEFIEIERGRSQLKAEGVRGNRELEVIYDLATGRIIRQETGRADDSYIGRSGVEIANRDRDFVGEGRSGRDDDDDDDDNDDDDDDNDDDDDDDSSSSRSSDDFDDDDDDDDRSSSSSGRDDDDDDDDDDDSGSSSSDSSSSGSDDNDDDDDDGGSSGGSDDNDDDDDDD